MNNNTTLASVFCVWNNPRNIIEYEHDVHGNVVVNEDGSYKVYSSTPSFLYSLTEQEVCETVLTMWVNSGEGRVGAVTYCISPTGLHHLHMVLEVDSSHNKRFRFSAVKKLFPKAHLEPTRGNKQEAEDYINKEGKYMEKGEQVIAKAQVGEIRGRQGNRTDLQGVEEMIKEGLTPNEIMDTAISLRRYEKIIKDAYYRKRDQETPFVRPVRVIYHVGESGTGKTFMASQYIDDYGPDSVYFCADYENGFLDGYNGQPILWLDEYRGQLKYSVFLSLLDKYKTNAHARYSNVLMLWNEVHITSVLPPEAVYSNMTNSSRYRDLDTYKQLSRRIKRVIYHYKDGDRYCQYGENMADYKDYETLRYRAGCDIFGGQFETVSQEEAEKMETLFGKE